MHAAQPQHNETQNPFAPCTCAHRRTHVRTHARTHACMPPCTHIHTHMQVSADDSHGHTSAVARSDDTHLHIWQCCRALHGADSCRLPMATEGSNSQPFMQVPPNQLGSCNNSFFYAGRTRLGRRARSGSAYIWMSVVGASPTWQHPRL